MCGHLTPAALARSATQQQLQEQHASRRVTDDELDEHLRFLATIGNMHGVSDHDLLFDGKVTVEPNDGVEMELNVDGATHDSSGALPTNEADDSLARLVLENYSNDGGAGDAAAEVRGVCQACVGWLMRRTAQRQRGAHGRHVHRPGRGRLQRRAVR